MFPPKKKKRPGQKGDENPPPPCWRRPGRRANYWKYPEQWLNAMSQLKECATLLILVIHQQETTQVKQPVMTSIPREKPRFHRWINCAIKKPQPYRLRFFYCNFSIQIKRLLPFTTIPKRLPLSSQPRVNCSLETVKYLEPITHNEAF